MEKKTITENRLTIWQIGGWVFGIVIVTVGILNIFLVHPVPGLAYLLLSLVYLPPANAYLQKKYATTIPLLLKIMLAIVIVMFTLGVSDLGDMIDKL